MVEESGRLCEDISGVVATSDIAVHEVFANGDVASTIRCATSRLEGLKSWDMRDPIDLKKCEEENAEETVDDANAMMLLRARYRTQLRKNGNDGEGKDVDELAERLGYANVSTAGVDMEAENLLASFETVAT